MTLSKTGLALALAISGNTWLALPAAAEAVAIPLGQQGKDTVQRPTNGTNKLQVEAVFGEPLSKHGPVGEPPISYWEYPNYTVYFEGDLVLHSVLAHHKTQQP